MAPWARVLAQVLFTVGNVFVRAFGQALSQAQQQSARGGNAKETAARLMGRMSTDEAKKILNISKPYTIEDITKQFESIFSMNYPKNGGSYYLQCKAEHAMNALNDELQQEMRETEEMNAEQNGYHDRIDFEDVENVDTSNTNTMNRNTSKK